MKKLIFCAWMFFIFPITAYCWDKESHIKEHFQPLVKKIQTHTTPGPLAQELARYVIMRQLHEDGPNKSKDCSVPGLSYGSPIKEIVHSTNLENVKISSVRDSDGVPMIVFKGEKAKVIGGVVIAKLFDHWITNTNFFKTEDRELWERSKRDSYLIANNVHLDEYRDRFESNKEAREKIIKRCNRLYGPASSHIEQEVKRTEPILK
jgi:hypothetical protein